MSAAGDREDRDDVDATFAAIVAGLRAEGVGAPIPANEEAEESPAREREKDGGAEQRSSGPAPTGWRPAETDWDPAALDEAEEDDEHFVPPEPPPLPHPRKSAFVVLLFFLAGLLLLIAPRLIGLTDTLGTPLGIVSLTIALAGLLLRVRQGPPDGADPDNGAQV